MRSSAQSVTVWCVGPLCRAGSNWSVSFFLSATKIKPETTRTPSVASVRRRRRHSGENRRRRQGQTLSSYSSSSSSRNSGDPTRLPRPHPAYWCDDRMLDRRQSSPSPRTRWAPPSPINSAIYPYPPASPSYLPRIPSTTAVPTAVAAAAPSSPLRPSSYVSSSSQEALILANMR